MRLLLVAALLLLSWPLAQAGTRDDPELTDPANDVQRWPGTPTADPSSDFISVWFHEDADNLYLSMEVVQHITYDPDVTNVLSTSDHLIGAHVNGESERTGCSGWGVFNVRDHYYEGTGWLASLRIYWPMDQQTDGCDGDDYDVPVTMNDNVATFSVPWDLLAGYVEAGDELTVSDARAGSGSTWPATPIDYADNAPGRAYVVEYGAPPASNATTQQPSLSGTSDPVNEASNGTATPAKESPTPALAPILASAVAFLLRRKQASA